MPERSRVYFDDLAQTVDLGAPSRIVRGRLPAIEAIQDRFSRQLRVDLFQYLRYGVQVTKAQTNFEPHDEVMSQFRTPIMIGIVSMPPLRGFSVIAIDGQLVGSIVDRLCGAGEPTDADIRDDFSIFEARIARRLLEVTQKSIQHAWQGVADLRVELVRTELNTSFIAIADAQEPLITMRMQVSLATGSGEVVIAIPYPAIEPIRDRLSTAAAMTEIRDEDKRYWESQMREALARVPAQIRVELTRMHLTAQQVQALEVGQVIPVRVPATARAYCDDVPLFEADFGAHEGALAARVNQFIVPGNPIEGEAEDARGQRDSGQQSRSADASGDIGTEA